MTTSEEQLAEERARVEGMRIALAFQRRHPHDYEESAAHAELLNTYLRAHGLSFSEAGLEQAFDALTKMGVSFKNPAAEPPEPSLDEVAPIPDFMKPLETRKQVDAIPYEKFKEWRRGPHRDKLMARIIEIKRRQL